MRTLKKRNGVKKISRLSMVWMLCMTLLLGCAKEEDTGELLVPMPNETTKILAQQMEDHTYRFDMMMKHRSLASGDMEEFLIKTGPEQRDAVLVQAREEQVAAFEAKVPRDYREEDYMEHDVTATYFITRNGYCYEQAFYKINGDFTAYHSWEMKVFISKLEDGEFRLQQMFDIEPEEYCGYFLDGMELVDANFDGVLDLEVHRGDTGNQAAGVYSCFLFDGEQYNLCESYSHIFNAYINPKWKRVYGMNRSNAVTHTYEVYIFQDGEFRLERSVTTKPDENYDYTSEEDTVWLYDEHIYIPNSEWGEVVSHHVYSGKDDKELLDERYAEDSVWIGGNRVEEEKGGDDKEVVRQAQGVTAGMLLACDREPDAEAYFTDDLVFLGEYPVTGTIRGKKYETVSLYGRRDHDGSNSLLLSLDHKIIYEIPWMWENVYMESPKLAFVNADGDQDTEILLQVVDKAGIEWREDRLGLLDFQNNVTITEVVTDKRWVVNNIKDLEEKIILQEEEDIIEFIGDGETEQFIIPAWVKQCGGVNGFIDYVSMGADVEEGTIGIRLYAHARDDFSYGGVVIKCAIVVEDNEIKLEILSATQEY